MRALVSGGQTGVDRAALDAALELNLQCGGWCPVGRSAEDGPIPARYPLRETFSPDPAQRTVWNAFDADATLIVAPDEPEGGTRLAAETAESHGRPRLQVAPDRAGAQQAREWLRELPREVVLNVAGPRESEAPGIYAAALPLLRFVLAERVGSSVAGRRVLVTGGAGLLGRSLLRLAPPGVEVYATQRRSPVSGYPSETVELSDRRSVRDLFARLCPELVLHTAYGTRELERDVVGATSAIVDAAAEAGARLVHVSTDMVFDGERAPYGEDAELAPVNEYGRAKLEAERYVTLRLPEASVVRNSLITSFHPPDPRTEWVLEGLRTGSGPDLFVDEIRTPILVEDLARQIWEIARLEKDAAGVWHLAGPEALSRYALGTLTAAAHGLDPAPLRPVLSASFPAPRPRDLRLLTTRADHELPTRSRALSEALHRHPSQ